MIKNLTKLGMSMALFGALFSVGCGSGSDSNDGGDASTGTAGADGGGDSNVQLFGLSTGDSCFDIVSIAAGSSDGCMIGVADIADGKTALPVNYTMASATLKVGTDGSLGSGTIAFNMGTLTREGMPADSTNAQCKWHQTDTSMVTLTATNEFDISVTEVENMFAAACTNPAPPASGTCTSTWTWHMKKSTKTPPSCQ